MHKFCLTVLLATILNLPGFAQKDSLSKADKATLDSMLKNDNFLKLLDESKKNSVDVSIGVGNGSFSSHNQAVNATGTNNLAVFTPAIFYRTKVGFSIGVTGYLASDSSSSGLYQTGISAAYDYTGKDINAGAAYTRFISDQNKYNSKSLYQNDFYAYIKKSSGIIQPLLALGYSNGKYKEIGYIIFPIGSGIVRKDSTDNTSSYFYTSVGIEHDLNFYSVFSKNDELDIIPSLVLNAGSDKTTTTHTNKIFNNSPVLSRRARQAATNKFQLQSIAASVEMTFSVGKFFLQPNIYLDYYLPSTKAKRLSSVYSLTAGFSF